MEDLSNGVHGVEAEVEIMRGNEENFKIWVKDSVNDKLKELSKN